MVANHVLPKSTKNPKRENTGARTKLEVAVAERIGLLEAAVDAVKLPTIDAVRAAAAGAERSTPSIATAAEAGAIVVVITTTTTMMPRIAVGLEAGATRATGSPQKTIIVRNRREAPCSSLEFHFWQQMMTPRAIQSSSEHS